MSDKATAGAQVIDLMAALKSSLAEKFPVDEYQIHTAEPESLTVGQLNRVVRELREALYQEKLKHEAHQRAAQALRALVEIVEKAGLMQLSRGVELGPTVWFVKASERMEYAQAALAELDKLEGRP